jgi:hypothetical protein
VELQQPDAVMNNARPYPLAREMRKLWQPIFAEEIAKIGFESRDGYTFIIEMAPDVLGSVQVIESTGRGNTPFSLTANAGIYHLRLNLEVAEILGKPVRRNLSWTWLENICRTRNVDDHRTVFWSMPSVESVRPVVDGMVAVIRDYSIDWLREWTDLELLMREWKPWAGDEHAQLLAVAYWLTDRRDDLEWLIWKWEKQPWTEGDPWLKRSPESPQYLAVFKVFREIQRRFDAGEKPSVRTEIARSPLLRPFTDPPRRRRNRVPELN